MRYKDANQWEAPDTQRLWDYDGRTDGQPVYRGFNTFAATEADTAWVITKYVYTVSGELLSSKTTRGSWSGKTLLFT